MSTTVGSLPETPRGHKYIVTVTDYFSKWPEASPLRDKTAVGVADFLFSWLANINNIRPRKRICKCCFKVLYA